MSQPERDTTPLTLMFWNVHGSEDAELVADVAASQAGDVLVLAESRVESADLLMALDARIGRTHFAGRGVSQRIKLYSTLSENRCRPLWDAGGLSAYQIWPRVGNDILLIAAHLPSKLYLDSAEQTMACTRLRRFIEQSERDLGHRRTILMGDLNMDPFENGIVGSEGLHGTMDQTIALRGSRIVAGEERRFLYNPMWSRMGDLSAGPPGTYYYGGSGYIERFWHTFDQVLLRPDLLYAFQPERLRVVTEAGPRRLTRDSGRPDQANASDHFPVCITLDL